MIPAGPFELSVSRMPPVVATANPNVSDTPPGPNTTLLPEPPDVGPGMIRVITGVSVPRVGLDGLLKILKNPAEVVV